MLLIPCEAWLIIDAEQEKAENSFRATIDFQHEMPDRLGYVVEPHEPELSLTPDPVLGPTLASKPDPKPA